MNLQHAIEQYQQACSNSEEPPFYQIVSKLIESGYDQSFENDSYFDALCLTHTMLCRSFVKVSILTGAGANQFWSALKNPLENCLSRLAKVDGTIRMITINAADPVYLKELQTKFAGTFELINATGPDSLSHFVVSDGRMIRIESPHPRLDGHNVDATTVKAKVNFNDSIKAKHFDGVFDNLWKHLNEVNVTAS